MEDHRTPWHTETISHEVAKTVARLAGLEVLQGFYLAGGTALALHLGHRRSVDLDFFNSQPFGEDYKGVATSHTVEENRQAL